MDDLGDGRAPADQQEAVAEAADLLVSSSDEAVRGDNEPFESLNDATQTLIVAGLELAESRRSAPTDDLRRYVGGIFEQALADDELRPKLADTGVTLDVVITAPDGVQVIDSRTV